MRLARIKREKGDKLIESIDCVAIEQWITAIAKKTEIYLDRGAAVLSDDDFHAVTVPFTLKELLGAK